MTLEPQPLRLMGDYGAESPVWSRVDGALIPVERLPVRDETRALLAAWASRWQALAAPGILDDGSAPEPAERERLARDLESLRERLQAELGPDWPITILT